MELTIEQALQQGVAAHKEGKLQDAERLYRAILQSQPTHPDANHNLGVIAVSVNKADAALPLFKAALEANPKIEQFWLSYVDALIKEKQFDNAKQVLEQGKNQGVAGEKIDSLEEHLTLITEAPNSTLPKQKKSLTLSEKRKKLAENKKKKAKKQNLKGTNPSEAEINNLLQHYQNGRFSDAEKLAISITQKFNEHPFGWKVLGAVLKQTGRISDSLAPVQKSAQLAPQDAEAHYNLGITLQELGRLDEAEASYTQTIALKPDYAKAHYNLGITLKELGRLDEAEASYRQAIGLKPDLAEAHSNLGNTLQELGRLDEAEASYTQAIALKPDYAKAHYNLGITLKELGRLNEAEVSCRQAIGLKPDYAEAHNNLGATLKELGRLDEAEASYTQAVALKPDYAKAHGNLAKVLYKLGYKNLALESIKNANDIDPEEKEYQLILSVIKGRKLREESGVAISEADALTGLASSPLILNRVVEPELINSLYGINSRELDNTADARYGNGKCSPDFNLFQDSRSIIQNLAEHLTKIMMEAVKSDIYIYDSFFNILGAGGGSTPHKHIGKLDKDSAFNLGEQKYSLVYYLSVGDQDCSEPGVLKLYEPSEDILPSEGMITIIPANRVHSAVYGGKTDRVMIGVNFYSL